MYTSTSPETSALPATAAYPGKKKGEAFLLPLVFARDRTPVKVSALLGSTHQIAVCLLILSNRVAALVDELVVNLTKEHFIPALVTPGHVT